MIILTRVLLLAVCLLLSACSRGKPHAFFSYTHHAPGGPPDPRVAACAEHAADWTALEACLAARHELDAGSDGGHKLRAARAPLNCDAWAVAGWQINRSSGVDSSTCIGLGSSACKTFAQIAGRWGCGGAAFSDEPLLTQATTITQTGDGDVSDPVTLRPRLGQNGSLTYNCQPTTIGSGTLGTVTHKSQTGAQALWADLGSGASGYVGYQIVNSTRNAQAWVKRIVTGNVALLTQPVNISTSVEVDTFASGDSFTIQQPSKLYLSEFRARFLASAEINGCWVYPSTSTTTIEHLNLNHVRIDDAANLVNVNCTDCYLNNANISITNGSLTSGYANNVTLNVGAATPASVLVNITNDIVLDGLQENLGTYVTYGNMYLDAGIIAVAGYFFPNAVSSVYGSGEVYVAPSLATFEYCGLSGPGHCDATQAFIGVAPTVHNVTSCSTYDHTVTGGPVYTNRSLNDAQLNLPVSQGGLDGICLSNTLEPAIISADRDQVVVTPSQYVTPTTAGGTGNSLDGGPPGWVLTGSDAGYVPAPPALGGAPMDIGWPMLWLRGDKASNGCTWNDLTGKGNDATNTTGGNCPTYSSTGNGLFSFAGPSSPQWLSFSNDMGLGDGSTVFAVVRTTLQASYTVIFESHNIIIYGSNTGAGFDWGTYNNAWVDSGHNIADGNRHLIALRSRAYNDVDLFTDGVKVTSSAGTAYNNRGAGGVGGQTSTQPFQGDIDELRAFGPDVLGDGGTQVLTDAQVCAMQTYFADRYPDLVLSACATCPSGQYSQGGTACGTPSGAVTSVTGSSGVSCSPTTGAVNCTNTGVTGLTAGSNISLSASTGNVTISASSSGVTSLTCNAPLSCSASTGAVTASLSTPLPLTDVTPPTGTGFPYVNAGSWNSAAVTLGGDVSEGARSGSTVPVTVTGLQGVGVSSTPPTSGQILQFVGPDWAPEGLPTSPVTNWTTLGTSFPTYGTSTSIQILQSQTISAPASGYLTVNGGWELVNNTALGTCGYGAAVDDTVYGYGVDTSSFTYQRSSVVAPGNGTEAQMVGVTMHIRPSVSSGTHTIYQLVQSGNAYPSGCFLASGDFTMLWTSQ